MLLHQHLNRLTSPILAFSKATVLFFWPTICLQASKSPAITEITQNEYQTSSIKFLFHHIFGVYVASPSSTLSFRIFLSSIHLRERKNDSRFVAETSSAWVHSLIHLSKIENKNFFEKKPLNWRASNKRDTFRENKKTAEAWRFWRSYRRQKKCPKEGNLEWENGFEYFNFSIKSWRTKWNEGKFIIFMPENFKSNILIEFRWPKTVRWNILWIFKMLKWHTVSDYR